MLKDDIGINANTISHLLTDKGEMSIGEIKELTRYEEIVVALALGWLAKENRIRFFNRNYQLMVESMSLFTEIYY